LGGRAKKRRRRDFQEKGGSSSGVALTAVALSYSPPYQIATRLAVVPEHKRETKNKLGEKEQTVCGPHDSTHKKKKKKKTWRLSGVSLSGGPTILTFPFSFIFLDDDISFSFKYHQSQSNC
jgi:hypothetical protein